jgi:hypothetical protein
MESDLPNSEFVVESGRASGGRMFVRVIYQTTGKSRTVVGLNGRSYREIVDGLIVEVKREIQASQRRG